MTNTTKPKKFTWFTSTRKLDSLPVGARVTWNSSPVYFTPWVKTERGWMNAHSSFPVPWDAKTMLAYNRNEPFRVIETS